MATERPPKIIRSYRLVFRRRWRIFRIQNWRIPLPGGLELRALGYWLACLFLVALIGRLPLLGVVVQELPPSLRLVALPVLGAWALSSWEIDGRNPHRTLLGLLTWWLRPRTVAALRRTPAEGTALAPPRPIAMAPDLTGPTYPRGAVAGPARLLLRYPVRVALERVPAATGESAKERLAAARRWRVSPAGHLPLHRGRTLQVPAGRTVVFAPEEGPE